MVGLPPTSRSGPTTGSCGASRGGDRHHPRQSGQAAAEGALQPAGRAGGCEAATGRTQPPPGPPGGAPSPAPLPVRSMTLSSSPRSSQTPRQRGQSKAAVTVVSSHRHGSVAKGVLPAEVEADAGRTPAALPSGCRPEAPTRMRRRPVCGRPMPPARPGVPTPGRAAPPRRPAVPSVAPAMPVRRSGPARSGVPTSGLDEGGWNASRRRRRHHGAAEQHHHRGGARQTTPAAPGRSSPMCLAIAHGQQADCGSQGERDGHQVLQGPAPRGASGWRSDIAAAVAARGARTGIGEIGARHAACNGACTGR